MLTGSLALNGGRIGDLESVMFEAGPVTPNVRLSISASALCLDDDGVSNLRPGVI